MTNGKAPTWSRTGHTLLHIVGTCVDGGLQQIAGTNQKLVLGPNSLSLLSYPVTACE